MKWQSNVTKVLKQKLTFYLAKLLDRSVTVKLLTGTGEPVLISCKQPISVLVSEVAHEQTHEMLFASALRTTVTLQIFQDNLVDLSATHGLPPTMTRFTAKASRPQRLTGKSVSISSRELQAAKSLSTKRED